jgi:hypothetical protein
MRPSLLGEKEPSLCILDPPINEIGEGGRQDDDPQGETKPAVEGTQGWQTKDIEANVATEQRILEPKRNRV